MRKKWSVREGSVFKWHLPVALLAGMVLAGCGDSGSGSNTASDGDVETRIVSDGRLAITESEVAGVHVLDLDDDSLLARIDTDFPPSALYASEGKRYAVAIQRMQDVVQFVDGGLWQEDHVDHLHDYEQAPALAGMRLTGIRPTHFEVGDGMAALFMDGNAETGVVAGVVTFDDEAIEKGTPVANLELPLPMHGTAEPRGDFLLTTSRAPTETSTLPDTVELYRQTGDTYELVQRFNTTCPRLHGSFSNENHSAFGCADGVLVITQTGDTFTETKIANPPDMSADARIGTIIGHHDLPVFVGMAGPGGVYEIDPATGSMTMIDWGADRTRIAQAFDHEARHFMLLDDTGTLHLLDVAGNWAVKGSLALDVAAVEGGSRPSLEANPVADQAFVSDPQGRQIVVVDTANAAIERSIAVPFSPGIVRWLGIAGGEAHDHD